MKLFTLLLTLLLSQLSKLSALSLQSRFTTFKQQEQARDGNENPNRKETVKFNAGRSSEIFDREAVIDQSLGNVEPSTMNQLQSDGLQPAPIRTRGTGFLRLGADANLLPDVVQQQNPPSSADFDLNNMVKNVQDTVIPHQTQDELSPGDSRTESVKPVGRWCIKKIDYVDRLEKTQLLECEHKNITQCHLTYVTHFSPHVEQLCVDDFIKTCHITFTPKAINNTVKNCEKPYKEVCPEHPNFDPAQVPQTVCKVHFVTQCSNVVHASAHDKQSHLRESGCWKVPRRICAPDFCQVVEGPEECYEKVIGATVDEPEEQCHLQPNTICRNETRLLPKLIPQKVCRSVPKDVCNVRHHKAKPVQKAVELRWCTEQDVEQEDGQGSQGLGISDLEKRGRRGIDYVLSQA